MLIETSARRLLLMMCAHEGKTLSVGELTRGLELDPATLTHCAVFLQQHGVLIESVAGPGYRLVSKPKLLLPEFVQMALRPQGLNWKIQHYFQLGSTNDVARELAEGGGQEGLVVVAEEQLAGRGRLQRTWFSQRGTGIYMSLVLRPTIPPRQAPLLNLVAAVAVSRALESECALESEIKWPNDILTGGRKCCGILTEMEAESGRIRHVVLGIGLNVNQDEFPDELADRASSVFLVTGCRFDRSRLLRSVLATFEEHYLDFTRLGSRRVIEEWTSRSPSSHGCNVTVQFQGDSLTGVTDGINPDGALRVRLESGTIREVVAGDVMLWDR
ncbi:MAG: biotin--[acetyl-CoA-carboxylase] ligase [Acidobacteriota bacterium]